MMKHQPHLLEVLEDRRLLAWGTYPQLIQQDTAATNYPTITGAGINIALIDSGVDFSHAKLQGKFWTNPGEIAGNGIDDDSDGLIDDTRGWDYYRNDNTPEDENGHGTAMAGILAGDEYVYGGASYRGVATGAKIIPLKIADPTGAYSLAFAQRVESALKWVEANATRYNIRIVSMSVRTPSGDYFSTYSDEISRIAAKGVMLIAAGGQEDDTQDVVYPAADPNVYGVSVLKANNTFPTDTVNRGPGIDLLAPGDGVPILLRGGGVGVSALATSYSTPFVSGAAALLMQINPSLTNAQIISTLKNTGGSVFDSVSGLTFKSIKLNAALTSAKPATNPQTPFLGVEFLTNAKIQAEDFDNGGEGIAYHDTEGSNLGGQYRNTGVDIEPTADKRGGVDVTAAKAGEWLEYTIYVSKGGTYTFNARTASKSKGGTIHLEIDGINKTGPMVLPKTGSWQTWIAFASKSFTLTKGTHIMRVSFDANNLTGNGVGSFNWFSLTSGSNSNGIPATATAAAVVPAVMPQVFSALAIAKSEDEATVW